MTEKQRQAKAKVKCWRENPVKFVNDEFKVDPDKWQIDVLEAFASNDPLKARIGMQACVGPGKTALLAWCGWNFLSCYGGKGEHPKGAAVSVTGDNLADNLWPEFSKWQARSEYLTRSFTWTKSRIFANQYPDDWFMSARSYSKTSNAEEQGRTLSGLHSKYVLALIDESGDIPIAVAKAAEQALSTKPIFGKILQAGNPTSHEGMLYAAATTLLDMWYLVRITGDPDDVNRSPRIDIEWAKDQIKKFGRDNPWVMSSILGLFPPSSINSLLGPDVVAESMARAYKENIYAHMQRRLGVDVALHGDDRTVLFPRQGLMGFKPVIMRTSEPADIAARIMAARDKFKQEIDFVDASGGWGSGVISHLNAAPISGGTVQGIQFAGKSISDSYFNKRAEMWFEMAEWIKNGGRLPNMPELAKELTAPTFTLRNGKFLLEPKDQIKKRLKFSPDIADALALTFALPDMPASPNIYHPSQEERGKVLHEYDPLA